MSSERYAILCVDDDPELITALRAQLREGLGGSYLIDTAEDGDEAEEVFDELLADGYQIPVVIADYIMPRLKGDELLRRIHALSPECKTILLTGHATPEAVGNVVRYAGLYRYLAKPLDMQDLLLTVNEALSSYFQARKLVRFHRNLEERIEARTHELAQKNRDLQHEISERKRVEADLLKARDAAQAANRSKGDFLAGISHDLRTPLNAILGYADLLDGSADVSRQREYAAIISRGGKHLLALIDDLLDLSRGEAGKIRLKNQALSLRSLMEEVAALHTPVLEDKGLAFELSLAPSLPEVVMLDPMRLRQVLMNLLGNAIKFTEHGRIGLKLELGGAGVQDGRVELLWSVSDTGIGIDAEHIPVIFEPFEQSPGQFRQYGGTGLGLAISRRLVEAMGGSIAVDSVVGEGSVFRVRLPAVMVVEGAEAGDLGSRPGFSANAQAEADEIVEKRTGKPPAALLKALADVGLPAMLDQDHHLSINQLRVLVTVIQGLLAMHPYPPLAAIVTTLEQAVEHVDMRTVSRILPELAALSVVGDEPEALPSG